MLASSVDDDDPTHTIVTLTSYDSRPHRRIFRLISRGGRGRAGSRKRLRRCLVLFRAGHAGPLACAAEVGASYKGE